MTGFIPIKYCRQLDVPFLQRYSVFSCIVYHICVCPSQRGPRTMSSPNYFLLYLDSHIIYWLILFFLLLYTKEYRGNSIVRFVVCVRVRLVMYRDCGNLFVIVDVIVFVYVRVGTERCSWWNISTIVKYSSSWSWFSVWKYVCVCLVHTIRGRSKSATSSHTVFVHVLY